MSAKYKPGTDRQEIVDNLAKMDANSAWKYCVTLQRAGWISKATGIDLATRACIARGESVAVFSLDDTYFHDRIPPITHREPTL